MAHERKKGEGMVKKKENEKERGMGADKYVKTDDVIA